MFTWMLAATALAEPVLEDVGRQRQDAPVALLVVTPCVDPTAWLPWAEAVEAQGLDAWTVALTSRGQDPTRAARELRQAADGLAAERGPLRVAAHGYGGVLVLLAELPAERLALVATPLGPQAAPVVAQNPEGPVAEGLPWPATLVGALPPATCSGDLARAYRGWATDFPVLATPQVPVLLLGSDLDVVAPPETMRLPSADWPGREWHRVGIQSMALHDPSHAELLLDPRVAQRMAAFLGSKP